jgi:hypothetical protein
MAFVLHNSSRDNIRPLVPCDSTQPATEKQKYPLELLYEKLSNHNEKTKLFTNFRSVTCAGIAEVTVEEAGWNLNANHSCIKTRYLHHTH